MDELMYDAVTAMGTPATPASSLIPSGQSLDLFVTLTDYHGYSELVQIHDPPMIHEVDHHHMLRFGYRRWANGEVRSDFVMGNAPALAFAARATSSFPGAFPPARIVEMDELVARHQAMWPLRDNFIANNFDGHRMAERRSGRRPRSSTDRCSTTGRFARPSRRSTAGRPTGRSTAGFVYIDPDPTPPSAMAQQTVPGFFSTLRGAMSDIPRTQPVTDELSWVAEFNEQVSRIKGIVESARPHISALVASTIAEPLDRPISPDELRHWREKVNAHVASNAGFAYEGIRSAQARLGARFSGLDHRQVARRAGAFAAGAGDCGDRRALDRAARRYVCIQAGDADRRSAEPATELPRWAEFLLAFDVKYRERRLQFLIEGQNRLYEMLDSSAYLDLDPQVVDRLKRSFYAMLDNIRARQTMPNFGPATNELVQTIFAAVPSSDDMRRLDQYADRVVEQQGEDIDRLIDRLAIEIDLDATTHDLDVLLATLDLKDWHRRRAARRALNYLGFPFWDVLTFPLMSMREIGEFNQILVDRISPQDAQALIGFGGVAKSEGHRLWPFCGVPVARPIARTIICSAACTRLIG